MKNASFLFSPGCGELLIGYHILIVFNEQIVGEGVKIMKIDWHESLVGVHENNEFHVFPIQKNNRNLMDLRSPENIKSVYSV